MEPEAKVKSKSFLTVSEDGGQCEQPPPHEAAGIGVPKPLGARGRRVQSRLCFAYRSGSIYDGLGEAPAMEAGSKWPVRQPRSDRPHVIGVARGRVIHSHLESEMLESTAGAIRPKSVQLLTLIKRVRRHLARRGHSLLITRAGSDERETLGRYAVIGADGNVLERNADLAALARFLGVLAEDERLKNEPNHWRYYVAQQRSEEIDGRIFLLADQLSRAYTTLEAARKAAARFKREGLTIVGYDARGEL